ncbi:hypothetical protein D3C81_1734730 [compost metagenome]
MLDHQRAGGQECRHGEQRKDGVEAQMQAQQFGTEQGPGDAAEAADAKHPRHPGGTALRRVERGGQRRHRRLRAVHGRAGEEDQHAQQHLAAGAVPHGVDQHAGGRVGDGDHLVRIEAVHEPARGDSADAAAEREQRRQE